MARFTHRWLARAAGAVAAAVLIVGSSSGATFAAETDRTVISADTRSSQVNITAQYAVVATPHQEPEGCNGFDVIGEGTTTGTPIANGVWLQDEVVCTLEIPSQAAGAGLACLASCSQVYDINGLGTVVDEDGDSLYLSYHLNAPLTEETIVHPSGTFTITGGTGKYAYATGGGSMSAVVNLLDHDHVTCTLSGTMQL